MKSSRLTISVVFALFVMVASSVAQTGAIRATILFDFTVGNQTLAAGDYKVSINGSLLQVARIDGLGTASVMTNYIRGGPNQNLTPRLVLHCYGNHRFLSTVWIGEGNQGHELSASPAEREYVRTTRDKPTVVLASSTPDRWQTISHPNKEKARGPARAFSSAAAKYLSGISRAGTNPSLVDRTHLRVSK